MKKNRMLLTMGWLGVVVVLCLALLAGRGKPSAEPLLALILQDTAGAAQPLSQWRGNVLVLNFWATWCEPCRREMADFSAVSSHFSGNDVQFVGIGIDRADKIQAFEQENPVSYPLLVAGQPVLELTAKLGNSAKGMPFTLITDRDGVIHFAHIGVLSAAELEQKIRILLRD